MQMLKRQIVNTMHIFVNHLMSRERNRKHLWRAAPIYLRKQIDCRRQQSLRLGRREVFFARLFCRQIG